MLTLISKLQRSPVMSLQTGSQLAHVVGSVVNPKDLTVVAFEIAGQLFKQPAYLLVDDVREYGHLGLIIDSIDELVSTGDIIKLDEIVSLNFQLVGLVVIDEQQRKLGKVKDFSVETGGFVIQQLQVEPGFFKGISDTGLLINRSQVVDVSHARIVVKSTAKKIAEPVEVQDDLEYVNPFRRPAPQPE